MFSHHQLSPSLHSSLAAALVHAGDDVGAEGGGGGGGGGEKMIVKTMSNLEMPQLLF